MSSVHYNLVEDQETQMNRRKAVEFKDQQRLSNSWQSEINISQSYWRYCAQCLQMLTKVSSMCNGHLGGISIANYKIELLPDLDPVHSIPNWAESTVRELHQTEIKEVVAKIYCACQTRWATKIVFALKKGGSLSFSVDCESWITIPFATRIPDYVWMSALTCSWRRQSTFSIQDASSGYWPIRNEEENRDKTAVPSHQGLHCFIWMRYDSKSAPQTFQQSMGIITASVKWQCSLGYLYHRVILLMTSKSYIKHVHEVLTLLQRAGVTVKLMKCSFFTKTISYLEYVKQPRQLRIAFHTADEKNCSQ